MIGVGRRESARRMDVRDAAYGTIDWDEPRGTSRAGGQRTTPRAGAIVQFRSRRVLFAVVQRRRGIKSNAARRALGR